MIRFLSSLFNPFLLISTLFLSLSSHRLSFSSLLWLLEEKEHQGVYLRVSSSLMWVLIAVNISFIVIFASQESGIVVFKTETV